MAYLNFITDEKLLKIVGDLLVTAEEAKAKSARKFGRNTIDPFTALFEMAGFRISSKQWRSNEECRQAQKTLSNAVGNFHQKILGSVNGWENLETAKTLDVVSSKKRIIAEIKNKYNTVKGSDKIRVYQQLAEAVTKKNSTYFGFTAYCVEIVSKGGRVYDKPFTPSDNTSTEKRAENGKIRVIDGRSFYDIATGKKDSLERLFSVLPKVIVDSSGTDMAKSEIETLSDLFKKAFR